MTRELSQNERRLAALAAIAFLWAALLVAVGFALWFVAIVVGAPLLVAAGFLQGRELPAALGSRSCWLRGHVLAARGRGAERLGRIDWAGGREKAAHHATATASKLASRGQALGREVRARRSPKPAAPGRREARRLNEQAAALRQDGRAREAIEPIEQALEIYRRLGDPHGEAFTLNGLGLTQARLGDEAGAVDSYEKAVALLSELGDGHGAGRVLANLGFLHRGQGHEEQARATWNDALERLEPGTPEHDRTAAQLQLAS